MTIRKAVSTADLMRVLYAASPGDVVRLAPGAYEEFLPKYLVIKNPGVTIEGAGATFAGMYLQQCEGLTIRNATINPRNGACVQAMDCAHLVFASVQIRGTGADSQNGIFVRRCKEIRLAGCKIEGVAVGIAHLDCDRLSITDCVLRDIGFDGIRGGGSVDVDILRNQLRDFHPSATDHPDAIQFWTTGATRPGARIRIIGNLYDRGAGGIAQGIFVRDETGIGYDDVVIRDNIIVGGMYNGIMVQNGRKVEVTGNAVVGLTDMESRIRITGSTDVICARNAANAYIPPELAKQNKVVPQMMPGDRSLLEKWRKTHPSAAVATGRQSRFASIAVAHMLLGAGAIVVAGRKAPIGRRGVLGQLVASAVGLLPRL